MGDFLTDLDLPAIHRHVIDAESRLGVAQPEAGNQFPGRHQMGPGGTESRVANRFTASTQSPCETAQWRHERGLRLIGQINHTFASTSRRRAENTDPTPDIDYIA